MSKRDYFISPTANGWKAKRIGAKKAAGVFRTQIEAESAARKIMQNGNGGELITQGLDGKIRSKDTINGNESSIKDREH